MSNWKKIALISAAILAVAPFVLLHIFVLCARIFEPRLRDVTPIVVAFDDTAQLSVFVRRTPAAARNLVFVHGSPATANVFHAQFEGNFPGFNLVAYDRPGYGGSSKGMEHANLASQVRALGTVLSSQSLSNAVLVGHSYGAPVALAAAIEYPQWVRGVILVGGSVDPSQEKVMPIQAVASWPIIRALLPQPVDFCNREILALRQDLLDLRPRLGLLRVPVIMVHGLKDSLVPPANVAYLRSELALAGKAQLFSSMVHSNYNHFIPWEHPDAVRAAVDQLAGHHPAGPPGGI